MDSVKIDERFNWKYSMREDEVTKAVNEYKARNLKEFQANIFAEMSDHKEKITFRYGDPKVVPTTCPHQWHTHTQAQFMVPTGESNDRSGAGINRIEFQVTKVFCRNCLEVKSI